MIACGSRERAPIALLAKCELPQMSKLICIVYVTRDTKQKTTPFGVVFVLVTRGRIELPLPP